MATAQSSDPMPASCGMSDSIAPSGQGGQPAPSAMTCGVHLNDPVFQDFGRFLPPSNTRKIRVHANFIVLQKLDGTGNFQDIPEHRAFLDEWLAKCNFNFANLWGSGDSDCQIPATDAKVEIIPNWIFMIDPSEYFWDNTNNPGTNDCPNQGSWWLNTLDATLNANSTIPRGINVYFTTHGPIYHQLVTLQTINDPEAAGMPYTWCSEWPSRTDLQQPSRVHIANLYLKYYWFKNFIVDGQPFSVTRNWLIGEGAVLAHEFGHSFIQEYNHETFGCENHLLSTGGWRTVLRQLDVEYIHRGLVYNSLRQFIDCDETYHHNVWSSENEWVIDEDETWKLDMRLYNHVRVTAGATLTITCKVLMPQWGIITLERGARLIVNGGQVQRANTCGPEEYWHGIYAQGNSNLNQPDPNGLLNAAQGSVVLLYGDGMIEGAKRGISTSFSPFGDVPDYRGSLIQANGFTFRNCSKGVEFNKYNHPNFSHFYDTHFQRTNSGSMGVGVSMWATNGVLFEDCFFQNMVNQGIISWDASYTVTKGNKFTGSIDGILAGGSMLLNGEIQVGIPGPADGFHNQFYDNTIGIRSTSNGIFKIWRNTFDDFDFDVAMTGTNFSESIHNLFKAEAAGVQMESTGLGLNEVNCNTYNDNIVGVNIVGNNELFTFREEQFNTQYHDLFLEGPSTNPGAIQTFQGSQGAARWNYFTSGKPEQIKTSTVSPNNNTTAFHYFYPDASSNPLVEPHCALNGSCTNPSNFLTHEAEGPMANCSFLFLPPGEEPCTSIACLDSLRAAIAILEGQLIEANDPTLEALWQQLVSRRERSVNGLVKDYMSSASWMALQSMLQADANPMNQRRLISLALYMEDWLTVDTLLSQFPNTKVEDQQFVQIQQINRDVLSDTAFVLTTSQETTLTDIATSGTTESGMAQTLLSRLTGTVIMPHIPDIGVSGLRESKLQISVRVTNNLTVSPNPAYGDLTIQWVPNTRSSQNQQVILQVVNTLQMQPLITRRIFGAETIQLSSSTWPEGVSLVLIRDAVSNQILESTRVVIQH